MSELIEKKHRGRQPGYRKPDGMNVRKAFRCSESEHEKMTKAREITGETETEFIRDAMDSKAQKVLKRVGKPVV